MPVVSCVPGIDPMTEGPMFETGVEKFASHVENEAPEKLRHLVDIGVHIVQAVLKCGAIDQRSWEFVELRCHCVVDVRHRRHNILYLAGDRDGARPLALHITETLADESLRRDGRILIGDARECPCAPHSSATATDTTNSCSLFTMTWSFTSVSMPVHPFRRGFTWCRNVLLMETSRSAVILFP